jgi:Na+/proline symporter
LFEWTGGLVSVAATDGIQGIVMVLGFILIPIIVATNFGGWKDLDPLTYPRPDFYQTPTKETQWLMWNFAASGFGFFSLPHMIQRTYAAKNLESIRWAYWSVAFGGLLSWLPVIFLGTMAVQILHDSGIKNPPSAFASIMEEIMDLGWFGKLVGVISFTSGLAAIMSTADSILIAIR